MTLSLGLEDFPTTFWIAVVLLALAGCDQTSRDSSVLDVADTAQAPATVGTDASPALHPFADFVELSTVDYGQPFQDLALFREITDDSLVVGLGESIHGTSEFFRLKHRLIEFLVREQGFSVVALEANVPAVADLNAYAHGEHGDPAALIASLGFWGWQCTEFLAFVEWVRDYNLSEAGRIYFVGVDMQDPTRSVGIVREYISMHDSGYIIQFDSAIQSIEHAQHQPQFAAATIRIDDPQLAGSTVVIEGEIRTSDVSGVWAGLAINAIAADGKTVASENMRSRGATGTTEWQMYRTGLKIPESAISVTFGPMLIGHGQAWFDNIQIYHRDSQPSPLGALDFDSEHASLILRQFPANSATIDLELESTDNHVLHLDVEASVSRQAQLQALEAASALVEHVTHLPPVSSSRSDAEAHAWARLNARIIEQALQKQSSAGLEARDMFMGENLMWHIDRNPEARTVLWSHSYHTSRHDGRMGSYIEKALPGEYRALALTTGTGTYLAKERGDEPRPAAHPLQAPPMNSIEYQLQRLGISIGYVDLRAIDSAHVDSSLLSSDTRIRQIGWRALVEQFPDRDPINGLDAVFFVNQSEPLDFRSLGETE